MNKINIIIVTIFFAMFFSSCESAFLDSVSYSDITKDNYYSSLTQYESALNGCYYYISGRGNNRDGNYITGLPVMGEAGTDEAFIIRTKGVVWASHVQLDDYSSLTPDNTLCQEIWLNHYAGINATNEIIDRINKMSADSIKNTPRYAGIKAEAQFLQALWYFNMVRIYGGVPVLKQASNSTIDLTNVKRDSIQTVYSQIIGLLNSAKGNLPETPYQTQYGRATKYSAYGLLSKVALQIASSMNLLTIPDQVKLGGINSFDWLAKDANGATLSKTETIKYYYQMAVDNSNVVLTHFAPNYLMPKFTDCFYPHESSNEILFEGIMSTGLSQEEGGYFGSLFGPQGLSSKGGGQQVILPINPIVLNHFTYSYTGSGITTVYSSADSRFLWTLTPFQIMTNGTNNSFANGTALMNGCQIGKFRIDAPPGYNQDRTPVNNPILRVSDICLVNAEAQAELDNFAGLGITDNALKFLNVVRQRASLPAYTASTIKTIVLLTDLTHQGNKEIKGYTPSANIEYFRNAIINERMLELLGEGHRWFDLVRMGILINVSTAAATYGNANETKVPLRVIQPFHIFRPLPTREISLQKGSLIQNSGYN